MQFEKAQQFIINKLKEELPKFLTYHNLEHTSEVLRYAEEIAAGEKISGDELTILRTAALLHDTGFLEAYTGHEEVSCSVAKTYLPQFEYSNEQIDEICELIMATKLPQSPQNKLGEILC